MSIVQKLKCSEESSIQVAEKYYSILSAINKLRLTEREVQLVALCAVRGNMTYANVRQEFCERYSSSVPTINNIVFKLTKMGVLVKDGIQTKVAPVMSLNFEEGIKLEILLYVR